MAAAPLALGFTAGELAANPRLLALLEERFREGGDERQWRQIVLKDELALVRAVGRLAKSCAPESAEFAARLRVLLVLAALAPAQSFETLCRHGVLSAVAVSAAAAARRGRRVLMRRRTRCAAR